MFQTSGNELILNAVNFNAGTFTIDLPVIGTDNGPFRLGHNYVAIYTVDFFIVILGICTSLWLSPKMWSLVLRIYLLRSFLNNPQTSFHYFTSLL